MSLYSKTELYDALKEINIIPLDRLDEVFKESKKRGITPEELLISKDLVSDINLGKVISEMISIPFIDLSGVSIEDRILNLIPEVYAQTQKVVAFKVDREGLHLASVDPSNVEATNFVAKKTGLPVKTYYTTSRILEEALGHYAKSVEEAFEEIINSSIREVQGTKKAAEPSIVKIVDTIISYAYKNKASDIHIEPGDDRCMVRFRVDGILHDITNLPGPVTPQVVTRIKVMSKLRTDEHQSAQDGRITFKLKEEDLDIRVSIVPVTKGEKIVMRLLSERSRAFSLRDLGFSDSDLTKITQSYKKPHGMILATGPTGSGKTTTLYAILKLLNKRDVNIMTIEEPVEYEVEGVNQIQVNPKTNLTFAEGLRSIVRQNPDIILVGEIRDEETASIAVNAAMTGHMVLSSLHTNDAATAFPRLLDFGVEPYLVASTVNVIVAQRLVRRICVQCRFSKEVDLTKPGEGSLYSEVPPILLKKYLGEGTIRVYQGKGCAVCHDTGYVGREGIYEVLIANDLIKAQITAKKAANEIERAAVTAGMTTMYENGLEKVKRGITTIEEVLRVIKE